MSGLFSGASASSRVAWILVIILAAISSVLIFKMTDGSLPWKYPGAKPFDYVTTLQDLAAQDRSQPLRMRLEAQYPGPLQDTTIERWRDPVDGSVCYVYLPIAVAHLQGPGSLVQYGAANIGSMSCFPGR